MLHELHAQKAGSTAAAATGNPPFSPNQKKEGFETEIFTMADTIEAGLITWYLILRCRYEQTKCDW